jgi:glycosyltransferase involved in cell wall biosynthesis
MALFFPSSLLAGIKLCRKNRYDVISVHFVIPSGPSGVLLSRMFHIPVTTSVYGGDVYDPSKNTSPHRFFFTRKLISWLLNSSDAIIAESGNIKELTEKYYQPKAKVEVIPVGFMVPAFAPVSREELGLRPDDFLIISIGRLVKRKGFDVAIQALAALPDQKMKYLIIGDGPEEQVLKALAKDLGVQDRVLFLGFQPEDKKYQYLAVADIYLLSSLHEGFGICLMEAMYSGLPIVSTDNGGQTDLLDDGRNALLAPAGDPRALAVKIKALVADYDARLRMRADNKKDIDKYSIKNVAGEYLSVLSGVR